MRSAVSSLSASTRLSVIAALLWITFAAAVYVPAVGRGFVKDDFAWVTAAAQVAAQPLSAFTRDASGTFYRPVVTLSFAGDYALYGLTTRGYGVTNLLLYSACAIVIGALFRQLGTGTAGAVVGAFAWANNPHGINMSLLWLSGRTSLLMTLFSCLSVSAFLRHWRTTGAILLMCAALSKEDALALPVIVIACRRIAQRAGLRDLTLDGLWMLTAVAAYFLLRLQTGAMMPGNAPSFYQLTWDPSLLLQNAIAYLDRSATGAAIIALIALAAYRARPTFTPESRRLLAIAVIWFVAGLAITIRIPVRSSLYAVFPSIGPALACAVAVDALRARARQPAGDRAMALALAAILLLIPVYRVRNTRYVEPAVVSGLAMQRLVDDRGALPDRGVVVFEDSPLRFSNFRDVFGTLGTEAVRLHTNRPLDAIVQPPGAAVPIPNEAARYRLEEGRVRRVL